VNGIQVYNNTIIMQTNNNSQYCSNTKEVEQVSKRIKNLRVKPHSTSELRDSKIQKLKSPKA